MKKITLSFVLGFWPWEAFCNTGCGEIRQQKKPEEKLPKERNCRELH